MKTLRAAIAALLLAFALVDPAAAQIDPVARGLAINAQHIICQSAVAQSATGTTSETTLATCTIPASAMGANGQVVIEALFSNTNSANNKTFKVKFGGSLMMSSVVTTNTETQLHVRIANRNATNSQVANNFGTAFGSSTVSPVTAAIDTTAVVSITITEQLATATDTATLESYQVILYPKT